MKIHYNLVQAVAQALEQIFNQKLYADKVVEQLLKSNPKWGSRDRAFIAEQVYDIVRHWRYLLFVNEIPYQDNKPNPYPTHIIAQQIGAWLSLRYDFVPTWDIFYKLNVAKLQYKHKHGKPTLAEVESVPNWLAHRLSSELGNGWGKEMQALNQPAKVILRCNTLKATPAELQDLLAEQDINTEYIGNDALWLVHRQNIFKNPLFLAGYFEVQDYSSQQVAPFLTPQPKQLVIDACAGAGGKTLHLATLMGNKGKIIALDTEEWKLQELKKRAKRAEVGNIETKVIANNKVIKRLEQKADKLLLDVPCSGLGVLKRNPDAKWKLSPQFLEEVRQKQQAILQQYSPMLKIGGQMVYATCSILPSENEKQITTFLESDKGKGFQLLKQQHLSPANTGFDGFYMALLERNA